MSNRQVWAIETNCGEEGYIVLYAFSEKNVAEVRITELELEFAPRNKFLLTKYVPEVEK